MTRVRLYARTLGSGSLTVVGQGFERVLAGSGQLAGVVALDRTGGSDETANVAHGAQAEHGVFLGPLNELRSLTTNARHQKHWVMVTPNSDYVPQQILAAALSLPEVTLLSPSRWATDQVRIAASALGVTQAFINDKIRLRTVRHGVHRAFRPSPVDIEKAREDYQAGEFRVLHFSTTAGERKGTFELVQAWALLVQRRVIPEGRLILALDTLAKNALLERLMDAGLAETPGLTLAPRPNLPPEQMRSALCFSHVLCAPSRGEGFGMCPLEARASGVPVVATLVTGHSEGHCEGPGCVPIETGPLSPIDDGPGALAPSVDPEAIAASLFKAYAEWPTLSLAAGDEAPSVQIDWSWEAGLRDWAAAL